MGQGNKDSKSWRGGIARQDQETSHTWKKEENQEDRRGERASQRGWIFVRMDTRGENERQGDFSLRGIE
jgi:hypothetical protein